MKPGLLFHTCYCLLFLLCYRNAAGQSLQGNELSTEKIIEENNRKYFAAIEKEDAKAFEKQFAIDCWIMVPNLPIYCGPGAAIDYFNEILLKKGISHGKFIMINLYGIGLDVLAEVGFYQFYDKSDIQFDDGKYIVLWKKTEGQWKRLRETMISSRKN